MSSARLREALLIEYEPVCRRAERSGFCMIGGILWSQHEIETSKRTRNCDHLCHFHR